MPQYVNYVCPSCGSPIIHDAKPDKDPVTESEFCSCCQRQWMIKDLENRPAYSGEQSASFGSVPATDALVTYADSSESALAYLENFLDTYNWDDFILTSELTIPVIDRMVEKILVKYASNPATWELQFMALSEPLLKKINGLATLEDKFFKEYVKSDDLANAFIYFDAYSYVASTISANGKDILKKLSNSIKYYRKYKGSPTVSTRLGAQLALLEQKINAVKPVNDYKKLPSYNQAYLKKQKRISDKLAEKGVDAEGVYNKAVNDYNAKADRRATLAAFNKVAGYKDAEEYINKLDTHFTFSTTDGLIVRLGSKYYILKKASAPVFNVNSTSQEDVGQSGNVDGSKRYSLYEIKDTKMQAQPVVVGITDTLTHFGGCIVYIKDDSSLCIFNSNSATPETAETEIIKAKAGDFNDSKGRTNYFIYGNQLFITTKLNAITEEKQGCFARLFKKKNEVRISNKNNYSLVALNLANGKAETVIPEMIDIMDRYDNQLFYTIATKDADGQDAEMFYSFNMETRKVKSVLSVDTEIVNVVNGKVIYFLWVPNDYNKDLYSLDLATGSNVKLDKNVYEYYTTIEDKIYYFIGNGTNVTLYSINVDGTGKQEIMRNAQNLGNVSVRSGWLYAKVGNGLNAALRKMSVDGKQSVTLCTQFSKLLDFKDGYVYYLDTLGSLRIVREDGTENKTILDEVQELVEITKDNIYLLKREYIGVVDANGKDGYSNSLYKVDKIGHNLTKVAFDVANAKVNSYDNNEIYLYKTSQVTFSISTPTDKDNYSTVYEKRTIKSLLLYNISSDSFTPVAVFGRPDDATSTFQHGCLKKKTVTKDTIIKEIPNKITYQRKGKMSAGAIGEEQAQQKSEDDPSKPAKKSGLISNANASVTSSAGGPAQVVKSTKLLGLSIVLYLITGILMGVLVPFMIGEEETGFAPMGISFAFMIGIASLITIFQSNKAIKAAKGEGRKPDKKLYAAIVFAVLAILSSISILAMSIVVLATAGI